MEYGIKVKNINEKDKKIFSKGERKWNGDKLKVGQVVSRNSYSNPEIWSFC